MCVFALRYAKALEGAEKVVVLKGRDFSRAAVKQYQCGFSH
jgi:hypothetical protein